MKKYEFGQKVAYNTEMNGALFVGDESADEVFKFSDHNKDIVQMLLEEKTLATMVKELESKYEFEGENLEVYIQNFIETLVKLGILHEVQ
ncbi:MAG: PqqD family peptide modification chaperone [Bacteriovoracaceae bacterium]|nr:PqqD family peptide modification chaperone [Bacteriovoracaceae bacterium]